MKKEIENKLELANVQIKKVVDFIKENKNAFDMMDLKLHKAFSYFISEKMENEFPLCNEEYKNDIKLFYDFCNENYQFFLERIEIEFDIDFSKMIKHIGSTSSFYLHRIFDNDDKIEYILSNLYDEIVGGYELDFLNFNYKGELIVDNNYNNDEDYIEIIENNIDYFINDFYNDVVNNEKIKDIISIYKIIEYFKKHQVEIFKDYLENEEERLFNEQEEEREIEEEKRKTVKEIKEKYGISDKDIQRLKFNL